MLFENVFEERQSALREKINDICVSHEQFAEKKENEIRRLYEDWGAEQIDKRMRGVIKQTKRRYFRRRIKARIKTIRFELTEARPDFDRMMYNINYLNKVPFSHKIVKYNPQYCKKIIDEIALIYRALEKYRDIGEICIKKDIEASYQRASNAVNEAWKRYCDEDLTQIAIKAAATIRASVE